MTESDAQMEQPRARPEVVFRPLAHEWVLYDPESRQLHVLNAAAAVVWKLCDGTTPLEAMLVEVEEVLPDAPPRERIRAHVREILEHFAAEGLLA